MSLRPNQSLAHYTILGPLGAGAMGEVYRAKDTRLEREVAIKVLPEHFAKDEERLRRFEREAKSLASLNHSNIAQIYGVEQDGITYFLALELVPGETLDDRLKRGAIPVDETLDICRQIAEGLEAAHEAGVIHRDLKPANIRITPDGRVKLLDFGLAKPAREGREGSSTDSVLSTEAGRLLGTPTYMAPEQARGKTIDKRVDIWAFGCVLYECLTATRAFAGETLTDVFATVLEREPAWTALPANTPRRIRELLAGCLAKDRKNRLHDIGDARIEIDRALAGREWIAGATEVRQRGKPLSAPLAMVAAAVLIALGAGLWSALGPRAPLATELTCVSVAMPPEILVDGVQVTPDGQTVIVRGRPRVSSGSGPAQQQLYVRRLDRFEFQALAGTEGVLMGFATRDSRGARFVAPVSPGSTQRQLAYVPLDGSSPPTTLAEWQDGWVSWVELASGEILIHDNLTAFRRLPRAGGTPSPPVQMDAGRPGIQRFEFQLQALPGDHGVLVNVVSYGTRGFQYGVGVLDPANGRVKVVEEDGGNARYSPTGHLVFARSDVLLAAPFDLDRAEMLAAPVAVWSGLDAPMRAFPGWFQLTGAGTLCYEPGRGEFGHSLAILGEKGALEPWWSERRELSFPPSVSPDGRHVLCQMINTRGIDELWISPVDHAEFVKLGSELNVDSFFGVWSSDSRRVAYLRIGRDDRDGVYIQDIDGGKPRRILAVKVGVDAWPTAWLADDSALVFNRSSAGKTSVGLLPLGEEETEASRLRPFLPSEFNRGMGRISSDGRTVAFNSDEGGTSQTWVAELRPGGETGKPIRVKTSGSKWHAWAADGKALFVHDERDRLMQVVVSVEPQLAVSEPVQVADLGQLRIEVWGVLPDGRFFVGVRNEGEGESRRYDMVLNWTEHMQKKVPASK